MSASVWCDDDRMLVTRDDGVRAIVCQHCYQITPHCIIENFDPRLYVCQTEAYPGAWIYGLPERAA